MRSLPEFLSILLRSGRAQVTVEFPTESTAAPEAVALLAEAYRDHCLQVAGEPPAFDADAAVSAAVFVQRACWLLAHPEVPPEEICDALTPPRPPGSPAQHLSADLTLRLLPQIHRRARAPAPDGALANALAEVLRAWPLSGVLSAVEGPPTTPPDFGGHAGLMMLYAERWPTTQKQSWLPRGRGFEYVEWVWAELGRDPAALPRPDEEAAADE